MLLICLLMGTVLGNLFGWKLTVLLALMSLYAFWNRPRGVFDLSHRLLCVDKSWGNVGLWHGATGYSDACYKLAELHARKSGLFAGADVVDVGFGCGDQFQVWRSCGEWRSLTGLNISQSQVEFAQKIKLERCDLLIKDHTFMRQIPKCSKDFIFAVDCAYHFERLDEFIEHSASVLRPQGKLSFSIITRVPQRKSWIDRFQIAFFARLCSIPDEIPSSYELETICNRAGLQCEIEDITEYTLPGFAQFLREWNATIGRMVGLSRIPFWLTSVITSWVLEKRLVRYELLVASK